MGRLLEGGATPWRDSHVLGGSDGVRQSMAPPPQMGAELGGPAMQAFYRRVRSRLREEGNDEQATQSV